MIALLRFWLFGGKTPRAYVSVNGRVLIVEPLPVRLAGLLRRRA